MVRQLFSEVTERAKIKDMLKRKRLQKTIQIITLSTSIQDWEQPTSEVGIVQVDLSGERKVMLI